MRTTGGRQANVDHGRQHRHRGERLQGRGEVDRGGSAFGAEDLEVALARRWTNHAIIEIIEAIRVENDCLQP